MTFPGPGRRPRLAPGRLPAAGPGSLRSTAASGAGGLMNPVEKVLRRADAAQQRHRPTAFVFGVVKKFGDDNGGVLVTNLVTILVNIAATDPALRNEVISGATTQFPLIGKQLASNIHVLRRSTAVSLTVGLLLLVWGVIRLAQAGLFAMEQVWNLPG